MSRFIPPQRMLASGEVRTRAELASKAGVSANRVSNLLALLKLDASIQNAVRALPLGTPERLVTERELRPLTRLPWLRQVSEVLRLVPGLLPTREVA